MSINIIRRGITGLAAVATTGTLVFATPGLAQAQQARDFETGNPDRDRSAQDGSGDAEARARATQQGQLRVFTEADGGDSDNGGGGGGGVPLPGDGGETGGAAGATRAHANASLMRRVPVADGTYRVVFRYADAQGSERDRGDSAAEADMVSIVRFVSQTGGENRQVQRVEELDSEEGNHRTVLLINVPNNESGFLRIVASLDANSRANGNRGFAQARGHVSDVSFSVNRV